MDKVKAESPERLRPGEHRVLLRTLSLVLLFLVSGFLLAAATRRLNFDEALALRSGWLLVEGAPGAPPFYMPTTLLLGVLGSLVEDPGTVFLIGRLTAASSVCLALFWSLRTMREPVAALMAAVLVFSQATFVVHGLEFRYDWAIMIGLLVAYGLLVRAGRFDFFWLGVCVNSLQQAAGPGLHTSARWRLRAVDKSLPCASFEVWQSRTIES